MNPKQPLNSRSRIDLEAKGGTTYDLETVFGNSILELAALSIFKIQVTYFHGFKSGILHWILKAPFILESKTLSRSILCTPNTL